jgi:hypothetical protein
MTRSKRSRQPPVADTSRSRPGAISRLAVYAALVSTLGVGWQVYSYSQQQGRVTVISQALATLGWGQSKTSVTYQLLMLNAGGRPVNVFGVDGTMRLPGGSEIKLPTGYFVPVRLDAAESKSVELKWPVELSDAQMKSTPPSNVEIGLVLKTTAGDVVYSASPQLVAIAVPNPPTGLRIVRQP